MIITVIESRKANDAVIDGLLKKGAAEVVIIDDFDNPEQEGGDIQPWCHVIANAQLEQHVTEYLYGAERMKPTPAGHTRFYINSDAPSVKLLLAFHINARIYVDHLTDGEEPDISMESKVRDALDRRKAHTTGILRTWVGGQVGRAIWIQEDRSARLVPYFITELKLVLSPSQDLTEGTYLYQRPSFDQPIPCQIERDADSKLVVRFYTDACPTRMSNIPADGQFIPEPSAAIPQAFEGLRDKPRETAAEQE